MNFIKKKLNNLTLFQKISLLIFLLFLCMNFFFFSSLQTVLKHYDETLYQRTADTLSYVTNNLESEINEIEALSGYISIDSSIQKHLGYLLEHTDANRPASIRRDIYTAFYSYFDSNPYITSISIMTNDSAICMGDDITELDFDLEMIRQNALDLGGAVLWVPSPKGHKIACVREIRQTAFLKLNELGILYIVLDLDQMVQDTLHRFQESVPGQHFIIQDHGKRIYPSYEYHDAFCSSILSESTDSDHGYTISNLDNRTAFIVHGRFSHVDWEYLYLQDYNILFHSIRRLKSMLILFLVIGTLFSLIIAYFLIRSIFRHMDYLIEKIQAFGKGKTLPPNSQYDYKDRQDEIGQLHRAFDEMTHNVERLRDENYDKQLLLRDAKIRILEQQINPHFLYNTLDTINWMAQSYHADDISIMVRSLGRLFRASITGNKDLIPLSEELEFLNNYIQIQKIRFKERLDFQICAPPSLASIQIPKLCIQPLVENAVKYSMECSDETCVIRVHITEETEYYRIQVSNSGSSFEENLLTQLQQKTIQPQGSGVGLLNINSRLQLLYGEQYGLHIHNEDGMAIVILRIPKQTDSDNRRS